MKPFIALVALFAALYAVFPQQPVSAQEPAEGSETGMADENQPPEALPVTHETLQVTATRLPEDVEVVPVSITVLDGDDLHDRGVENLSQALAMTAGVTVAPGGDGGPATSIPELWGLREADAYLLVVDGVPRGGAFNPDPGSVELAGVDRIEILRGAAPVLYGATSFVGVIHVIHRAPGEGEGRAEVSGGNYSSGSASVELPLPAGGSFRHSLIAGYEDRGFKDDRAGFTRGSVLYRAAVGDRDDGGLWSFDLEGTVLDQNPASPRPRVGTTFTPLVPIDANHNPRGAHLDQDRFQATGRYDRGAWSTTLSVAKSEHDILRGFLFDLEVGPDDARGFEQDRDVLDIYFDSHYAWSAGDTLHLIAGVDHLYGKGEAKSESFAYGVGLDGSGAPGEDGFEPLEEIDFEDERNFSGAYLQATWTPMPRWRVEIGARVNRTSEDRRAGAEPIGEEEDMGGDEEKVDDSLEITRGSGFLGVSYLVVPTAESSLWAYANYRNTFKPAAVDFGPEAEGGILDPETAESYEVGLKGSTLTGRLDWELSAFRMDLQNLVLPTTVNGLPRLLNAGKQRFDGIELEGDLRIRPGLLARLGAAWHDAKFRDYERIFDGVLTQLRGNRLELSAQNLYSAGVVWSPPQGFTAQAGLDYVGSRFLDKRNRAKADPYTAWWAGVGYRWSEWELRADGRNLGDERAPVAESELGDAQYYLLPARSFRLTLRRSW